MRLRRWNVVSRRRFQRCVTERVRHNHIGLCPAEAVADDRERGSAQEGNEREGRAMFSDAWRPTTDQQLAMQNLFSLILKLVTNGSPNEKTTVLDRHIVSDYGLLE